MGGAAVIADHPQHRLAVFGIAREGPELGRHLGRGGIGTPVMMAESAPQMARPASES